MAMMEWNDALMVGHSVIDKEHQTLVGLINKLGDAMAAGQGRDACSSVLDELMNYTQTHFATEERLMSLHHYPGAAQHKSEHAKLIQDVAEYRSRLGSGSATLSVSLLRFLMEWLAHHILESDKALARGIPPG